MSDELSFNVDKVSDMFSQTMKFLKNKKVISLIFILLLLATIVFGTWIRVQNHDFLKDSTTGEYIPLALDPFYFLRVAETILEQGSLSEFDSMRYIPAKVEFSPEIHPHIVVFMYKAANIFGDFSIQYINIISPVIFFALSLIVFFFLIYFLTKSKITALLSSFFLSVIPAYLYRTMSGFSDHESIGMLVFFSVMLVYTLGLKSLEKNNLLLLDF
jgi:asparagine N-glycosylation enzyme membrane subunit Stt3